MCTICRAGHVNAAENLLQLGAREHHSNADADLINSNVELDEKMYVPL